jgi:hypothetical protein
LYFVDIATAAYYKNLLRTECLIPAEILKEEIKIE